MVPACAGTTRSGVCQNPSSTYHAALYHPQFLFQSPATTLHNKKPGETHEARRRDRGNHEARGDRDSLRYPVNHLIEFAANADIRR